MAKQILVCVVHDHSGGDAGVITAGYVGGVCVGLVLERYGQIAYLDPISTSSSLLYFLDLLHHRRC